MYLGPYCLISQIAYSIWPKIHLCIFEGREDEPLTSAAAIWSVTDIVYIAIYRDMSEISRYCIAILYM